MIFSVRYKKMYKEEKERMEVLRRHFHDELRKKDEEIDRLRKILQAMSMESDIKVRSLEVRLLSIFKLTKKETTCFHRVH